MDVKLTDTIKYIKDLIESKTGINREHQTLTFAGKPLDDDGTIAFYNVQRESTLNMVWRNQGGNWNN